MENVSELNLFINILCFTVFAPFFLLDDADGAFMASERPSPGCGVQSVGAQSRAAAWCSCLFQVNKPKNPVIEIPTVKWKEGGLLVARPSRGLPPRDQLSIGN